MSLHAAGRLKAGWITILFILISALPSFCQKNLPDDTVKANLEIFYSFVDSAAYLAASNIPKGKNVRLNFDFGNLYSVFGNQLIKEFNKHGNKITIGSRGDSSYSEINFVINKALVNYGELFRKKFFGDFYTKRSITLSGNYSIIYPAVSVKNFFYNYSDTVSVSKIKDIENPAFPFTQSPVPAEPFFTSVYEPVIALGAAALTVILFFTVRSK